MGILQHMVIVPSIFMMFAVSIYNWKRNVDKPITFNELVKTELERFFKKINPQYKEQGIEWATIDGHYWLEVRL
jgi:hypothetical protein